MVWTQFPIQKGQRIASAMMQEIANACTERGIDVDPTPEKGYNIGPFLRNVAEAIQESLGDGLWVWVSAYSDIHSFSLWKLAIADTDLSTWPMTKDVRELANIDAFPDFSKGTRITADAINALVSVINCLTVKKVAAEHVFDEWKISRDYAGSYAPTCSGALSVISGHGWQPGWYSGLSTHGNGIGITHNTNGWAGNQLLSYGRFSPTMPASVVRVYIECACYATFNYTGAPEPVSPARSWEVRYGSATAPVTPIDAQSWGTLAASLDSDTDYHGHLNEEIEHLLVKIDSALPASTQMLFVAPSGEVDPTNCPICGQDPVPPVYSSGAYGIAAYIELDLEYTAA
jgi:hypothetical protein